MSLSKAMLLVPPELHAKLKRENLSQLDKEMHEILFENNNSDEIKWKLYSQCLQRFLHHARDQNKSTEIELKEKVIKDPQKIQNHLSSHSKNLMELDEVLPEQLKQKGKDLYNILRQSNEIKWNDKGEIKVDDLTMKGTNIVDFVSISVKPRQRFVPKGYTRFADVLEESSIPHHYFGPNILREDEDEEEEEEEEEEPDEQNPNASVHSSIHRTPAIANRGQKRERTKRVPYQHTWEKFSFSKSK
jgi:hypothetical protein